MTQQYRVIDAQGPDHHFKVGEIVSPAPRDGLSDLIESFGAKQYTNGKLIQALIPDQLEPVSE